MQEECVRCRNPGAEFSTRCGHFYHIECYKMYENAHFCNRIYCEKPFCNRFLQKYYEVEAKLFEIKLLGLECTENKRLYDCYEAIKDGMRAFYDWNILVQLRKIGFDINDERYKGPNQFYLACEDNDVERMNLLIDFGFDYRKYGSEAVYHACEKASIDAFERFLGLGVKIKYYPIFKAIQFDHPEMLKRLLKEGSSIDVIGCKGKQPINYAAEYGAAKVLDVLIENGADLHSVDYDGNCIFHHAGLYREDDEFIKQFDGSGFYFDQQNYKGETPLMTAIEHSNAFVFNFLINQDVDVNICDVDLNTPLHYSCIMEEVEFAEMLIKRGANLRAKNAEGQTPLHKAYNNSDSITRLLLDNGAEMHVLDHNGKSPFCMLHQELKDRELKRKFIESGADLSLTSCHGKRIRDLIAESKDADLLNLERSN